MASIGVSIKIDVTKIDKARLFEGKKGKYLDAVVFINLDEADQYGNHGAIKQEAKEDGQEKIILGNAKVFWRDEGKKQPDPQGQQPAQQSAPSFDNFDDDIPF